jgi:hypothetical protein
VLDQPEPGVGYEITSVQEGDSVSAPHITYILRNGEVIGPFEAGTHLQLKAGDRILGPESQQQKNPYGLRVDLTVTRSNTQAKQNKAQSDKTAQRQQNNPYQDMPYGDRLIAAAKMVPELLAGDVKAAYVKMISDPGFVGQLLAVAAGFAALQAIPVLGQAVSAALIMSLGFAGGYHLGSFLFKSWNARDKKGFKDAAYHLNKLVQIVGVGALSKILSIAGKVFQSLKGGAKADQAAAAVTGVSIPGVVQSRINVAISRTRFTPLRDTRNQVSAGFEHVVKAHFRGGNAKSQFTISQERLKVLLQSKDIVSAPVSTVGKGEQTQFIRVVDTKIIVGTVRKADGGNDTTWLTVYTDRAGNLITTYPVPAP